MASDRNARVLIVEDEDTLSAAVAYNLRREGYVVSVAGDGTEGLTLFRSEAPELVILDLMLPGLSGLDVLRQIRTRSRVPVIILTAKSAEADSVAGLELGADDYVTKPFSMRELVSRVGAQLRRTGWLIEQPDDEILVAGPVEMNVDRHEVRVHDDPVELRPKEFELLEALMRRPGRLVTRDVLLDEVWGSPFYGDSKTLDVHIRRVREKIEADPSHPSWIVTVRGLGYKFDAGDD